MNRTLFEEWLHELDRKFEMQGRKAVTIVDYFPAYPEVSGLKAINLQFLSPNTTSCTQSMDQGVIRYVCFIFFFFINKVNRIAMECLDFAVEGLHCAVIIKEFEAESVIKGHHAYMNDWAPIFINTSRTRK